MPPPSIDTATGLHRVNALRGLIAAALRDGVDPEAMRLKLTVRDAATLKRHPAVGVHEIAFADGEMRFLGVRVSEGGVPQSELERTAA